MKYTHVVKELKGDVNWGAFPNEAMADIMCSALSKRFSPGARFFVKAIESE